MELLRKREFWTIYIFFIRNQLTKLKKLVRGVVCEKQKSLINYLNH